MTARRAGTLRPAALVLALAVLPAAPAAGQGQNPLPADPESGDPVARGAYVFDAAGCAGCHTGRGDDAVPLAGGVAIKTPFGTFHAPNITPHPEAGIGRWSEADFARALREGVSPSGDPYYPAFPYTSYTGMTDRDIADLWAYLRTVPLSDQPNRPHELSPPFGWRSLLGIWRALNFEEGRRLEDPSRPGTWNRGAYLVATLGHCGECHTPRGPLGGLDHDLWLAGNPDAPEGEGSIPNITPDPETGIGDWTADDLDTFFTLGMMPDGDFAGGDMARVIDETTSKLTPDDRQAMIEYLRTLPPIRHRTGGGA